MPTRDPKCTHRGTPAGRVAWPTGMPERGQSHASTYVCERPACQEDAAEWVREITGVRGVFVPFPGPARPQVSSDEPQIALFAAATSAEEA